MSYAQLPRQFNEATISSLATACADGVARGGSVSLYSSLFAEFLRLYATCESPIESEVAHMLATVAVHSGCTVTGQFPIEGVGRVDFCVTHQSLSKPVVVECDGHDFHERTKEQARRDRKRDRDLQSKGYFVCRLTGHEIMARGDETFHSVLRIFKELGLTKTRDEAGSSNEP